MYKQLRPEDCALVLIDHQIISMTFIKTQPLEIAKQSNIALVKAAKVLAIPSVWTSSTEDANRDWWMPELKELDPEAFERRIKRTGIVDSWNDPNFVRAVEATGRRTLIMSGTTNEGCLLYTALNAANAGYEVHAVLDGSGSAFQVSEDAARLRMTQAGIIPTAADTVLGELAHDWSTPHGAQIRIILGDLFRHTLGGFALSQ